MSQLTFVICLLLNHSKFETCRIPLDLPAGEYGGGMVEESESGWRRRRRIVVRPSALQLVVLHKHRNDVRRCKSK
jgi:hypothetical protein